ncbi:MAG: DNA methylase N-4 [Burkholderiales bacterium]|nr:MAG: DNA methylase N-4 [Burkholderiales bacterium]
MNDKKSVNTRTNEPEPLDLRSHDIAADKRAELLRIFPEIRTEGGRLDFDKLRLALGEAVDVGRERFGLIWPGKAACFKAIQTPSLGTLRPAPEESVNFDATENLIIEGDNLEVLKLLQKSYLGKVKMIYIDPPYNTGNDFIYPDDYSESLRTYLEYTKQVDAEGRRFSTNTDTDGRFHSKWLNMMYPRLYLARNLLREDGVIFVSCDDNEVHNLRALLNEIFGEENFLAVFVRRRRMATGMRDTPISPDHEYVVAFARSLQAVRLYGVPRNEKDFPFLDSKGRYRSTDLTVGMTREMRPNQYYAIKDPKTGIEYWPPEERVWRFEPTKMQKHIASNDIIWPSDSAGRMTRPRFKTRFDPTENKVNPVSTWMNTRTENGGEDDSEVTCLDAGLNQEATKELRNLLGAQVLDYPKPTSMIKGMVAIATRDEDIILDFFAGSGTTAHAVLELNKQDGGNRKFILVQLPEPVDPESPAGKAGFKTIADICKERVRRVIQKLNVEDAGKLDLEGKKQGRGFRVFKLAESNFKVWDATASKDAASLMQQLELHVDHIREGRSEQDILYEILLKSGFALTTPVETRELAGKRVYRVADGAMLVCLERELTLEAIRAMAAEKPARVVCLDAGFAGIDQLKANAVQTFKTAGVASFKTV